ncbi:putative mucin-4 [Brachionus plicatilis]|uniref:Putative mucin-4 n=1 Tax=Brachionus plicatilis TaxID=10195 RepID=A0A3M7SBT8_BRAPC|nr:putative mucin-4 [Brachionus plicatilis]
MIGKTLSKELKNINARLNLIFDNKIVIRNLIFDYDDASGELKFKEIGKNLESHSSQLNLKKFSIRKSHKNEHWNDHGFLQNSKIAQASYVNVLQGIEKAKKDRFFIMPCNLDWSSANSRRFSISLNYGKCIRFIASSYGDIFLVIATNPNDEYTWYFIQISSYGVAFYRAGLVVKYRLDPRSGSLKNSDLFRRFFICFNYETRAKQTGLYVQYGIIEGYDSKEKVHLYYFDTKPIEPRYYMFGSYDSKIFIYDITVNILKSDEEVLLRCSEGLKDIYDQERCMDLCHDVCVGCFKANSSTSCVKCRYDSIVQDARLICLDSCPFGYQMDPKLKTCVDIDECSRNDTFNDIYKWTRCDSISGLCINTIGSYECKCQDGYDGDGFSCQDVDECDYENTDSSLIAECGQNSVCLNTKGGYECKCLDGFQKIGQKCVDVDECRENTHECQTNAYCVNKIGSYKCLCKVGFRGNGIYCDGTVALIN